MTRNDRPQTRVEVEATKQAVNQTIDQAKAIVDRAMHIWACQHGYSKEKILDELEALRKP